MKKRVEDREDRWKSRELRETIRRKREQSARGIYESLIEYERQHLQGCREPRCSECRGAKILVPYYRTRLKKALARIARED